MKTIARYTSPKGETFYDAYGPLVTRREDATHFNSTAAANQAICNRTGNGTAFWPSEINHNTAARRQFQGWNATTEPA